MAFQKCKRHRHGSKREKEANSSAVVMTLMRVLSDCMQWVGKAHGGLLLGEGREGPRGIASQGG